ncbi:ethanolamine ammonia-lyase reactivating factor EutA [Asanoa iriomotensis]|uniref:Ethanolamine utilization protein n=1 Tax=Asanoa iriomotensis TaxID=234613 RepID=A0ABQ4C3P4_9ACTN|nr:ethanolamine ammonia-lyase reactivating factor EutA [Asanoa iriomotensis]GIF57388.1 ethanolamine utilization protein [Asanoa iriomotensis]
MTVDDEHDDGPELPLEENPLWQQDNIVLHSVGIDIGSSGTQVAFSRLHLRRLGEDLTSRYVVVRSETLFESGVRFTPYTDGTLIDAVALGRILDDAYAGARSTPDDVDTGVVILTGEALRRRNAAAIAEVISERAGDLVCASAGHHMEAMLAAYGSGAVRASHAAGSRILNVDIGGGTTKLSLVERGRIVSTAAFHVGGRLVAADGGVVTRLEPGGQRHAARAGHTLSLGGAIAEPVLTDIARVMAGELGAVLRGESTSEATRLWLTEPIGDLAGLDGVMFSGGVSEYVSGVETRDFGDLGRPLGRELRAAAERGELPAPVLPSAERIRATVLGASQYSVQLSGITSYISAPERTLPRRNLPVVQPAYDLADDVDAVSVGAEIARHVDRFGAGEFALALPWSGPPEYPRLRALAEAVVKGLTAHADRPFYLVLDSDVARTLGLILRDELGIPNDLVVLDGVLLRDFDYVDLGRVRQPSGTVPVTIKSLVFGPPDPAAPPR